MRRRDVLKAFAGVAGLSTVGTTALARSQAAYAPLGRVEISGAKEAVLGANGQVAYVATTDGFAVVDVGDPENPSLLAERRDLLPDRENGPLEQVYDVKVDGDRLVVAGPANPGRNETLLKGFLVYDVSEPSSPEQLAFHETDFPIHNAFVRDGVAYLTGNNGAGNPLVMVDVSGDAPEEVGRWSMLDYDEAWSEVVTHLRTLHDVYVQDGIAYLAHWEAGTWLVDVTDPANPQHLTTLGGKSREELAEMDSEAIVKHFNEPPGNAHYCMPNEDASLLAVGAEAWDSDPEAPGGGPGGIDLWDISNVDSPTKLSTIDPPPTPDATVRGTWTTSHNFDIVGDRLYTSWYQGGVKIHDIADPANPEELAWWREPSEAAFWTAKRAGNFFIASSFSGPASMEGGIEGLYTFPDRAGEQENPPSLTPAPSNETSGNGTGGTTTSPTAAPTETESATQPATSTASQTPEETGTATSGQPGFGIATALGGASIAAWRYLRGEH